MPKSLVASVTGRLFLSKLQFSHKTFTLLLAKSNFHVSVFRFAIFGVLFSIIYFLIINWRKEFQVSAGRFRLSRFCCSDSNFLSFCWQFQFSRFCFSDSNFSSFCWQNPIFTLLLCKLLAETKVYFSIVFICVISAQLPCNVPLLQAVWD